MSAAEYPQDKPVGAKCPMLKSDSPVLLGGTGSGWGLKTSSYRMEDCAGQGTQLSKSPALSCIPFLRSRFALDDQLKKGPRLGFGVRGGEDF